MRVAVAAILVVVAVVVSAIRRFELERELMVAAIRALLQLLAIAAIVTFVFERLGLSAAVLGVMLAIAAWTSARRLQGVPRAFRLAVIAIGTATLAALAVLFGGRVFPLEPRWLIPIGGMLIGNSMTATSVAGMRLRDELVDKTLEVEARLALGVPARDALRGYVRRASVTALVPTVDATKNVGLILLPGAFVGMVLGGATPLEAAQIQLVVLFMLLGAVAIAAMVATMLVAHAFVAEGERIVIPGDML